MQPKETYSFIWVNVDCIVTYLLWDDSFATVCVVDKYAV